MRPFFDLGMYDLDRRCSCQAAKGKVHAGWCEEFNPEESGKYIAFLANGGNPEDFDTYEPIIDSTRTI